MNGYRPVLASDDIQDDIQLDIQNFQKQEQTQWCWAACTQAVCLNAKKNVSQWEIVRKTNGKSDWAELSSHERKQFGKREYGSEIERLNEPHFLSRALQSQGLKSSVRLNNISYGEIRDELSEKRPICIRMQRNGDKSPKDGHFLLIYGITNNNELRIWDPIDGGTHLKTKLELSRGLKKNPLAAGRWTHTYLIDPSSYRHQSQEWDREKAGSENKNRKRKESH